MKKTISILLCAVILVSLAACGERKRPEEPPSAPVETEVSAEAPTEVPTERPTEAPTEAPTPEPTAGPTPTPKPLPTEAPLPDDPSVIGDCMADAEVLAFIPFGEDGLGFADDIDIISLCPEDFIVEGGVIYVLDAINARVAVYRDGELSFIEFDGLNPFSDYYEDYYGVMAIVGDRIYACSGQYGVSELHVYNMDGERLDDLPLPVPQHAMDGMFVHKLYNNNGVLSMMDSDLGLYELHDGEFVKTGEIGVDPAGWYSKKTFTVGDNSYYLDTGEDTLPGFLLFTDDRVFFKVYGTYGAGLGFNAMCSYAVLDRDGRLIGCSYLPADKVLNNVESPIYISTSGELYVMAVSTDGVTITKPNLRRQYVDRLIEEKSVFGTVAFEIDGMGDSPLDFVVRDGEFYILNTDQHSVLRCNSNGELISSIALDTETVGKILFVGKERIYVTALDNKLYVFDKETGEEITVIALPESRPKEYENDGGGWYDRKNGFVGSIVFISETDNRLCFTVRETEMVMSAYVVDLENSTVERSREHGVRGQYNEILDDEDPAPYFTFVDHDTHYAWTIIRGDWKFVKLLGHTDRPIYPVAEVESTDENGNTARKILAFSGKEGVLILESAPVTDDTITFTLGDDGNVYAMRRNGDKLEIVLVNLY